MSPSTDFIAQALMLSAMQQTLASQPDDMQVPIRMPCNPAIQMLAAGPAQLLPSELLSCAQCRPCQVVIGTPGRIRALLAAKALPTSHMRMVILDEADQLMQHVFQEDMGEILSAVPSGKQVPCCTQ